jgi:hypothetical protein
METWAFRMCLLSSFSVDTRRERALGVVPHVVGARSTQRNGVLTLTTPGTSLSKFYANKIRDYFKERVFYSPTQGGVLMQVREKCSEILRKFEDEAMRSAAFLEHRQLPIVTLDVVPLPPPRIKPHERTRLPFHFSPIF